MTRPSKRNLSPDINHRSTKRRKPQSTEHSPTYSTRIITWAEQQQLPKRFNEHGEDVWPALRILDEKRCATGLQYLVEWEPHPNTLERFEPTWEPAKNVNAPLRKEWQQQQQQQQQQQKPGQNKRNTRVVQSTSPLSADTRATSRLGDGRELEKRRNNRVIPDSSDETQVLYQHASPEHPATPTLTGSVGSVETSPILEVAETQQPRVHAIVVDLPLAPIDKGDYESVRGSQFSTQEIDCSPVSPFDLSLLKSSQSRGRNRTVTDRTPQTPLHISVSPILVSSTSSGASRQTRSAAPKRVLDYQQRLPNTHWGTTSGLVSTSDTGTNTASEAHPLSSGFGLDVPKVASNRGAAISSPAQLVNSSPLSQASNINSISSLRDLDPQYDSGLYTIRLSQLNSLLQQSADSSHTVLQSPSASESGGFQTQLTYSSPSSKTSQVPPTHRLQLSRTRTSTSSATGVDNSGLRGLTTRADSQPNMTARATRQSPRLQVVTPALSSNSPRVPVRSNSKTNFIGSAPEVSSPLATVVPEILADDPAMIGSSMVSSHVIKDSVSSGNVASPLETIPPSEMHIDPTVLAASYAPVNVVDDIPFGVTPMPIQESIEEEPVSSNEDVSLESKASSSQESLRHELVMAQIMPTFPILGDDEYALFLPAEGKVQAIYGQTIKVKRKAISKFIHRKGSVNLAGTSATKTIERNEMLELIQRLHDITTHTDLGLPGIPTQYIMPSQEHAIYAEYAGSKFVFLGTLVDDLMRRDCTLAIMAQRETHDLIEEYLVMKHVDVRRHDRHDRSKASSQTQTTALKVELLPTKTSELVNLDRKPVLIIAFDASYEAQEPQTKRLRAQFPGQLPVLYLMVTNSSEHVERCLPVSMPSPNRLKALVTATYRAHANLGGPATLLEDPSEYLDGHAMDMSEISRAIRKSPKKKLMMLAAIVANTALSGDFAANWTLTDMPQLMLDDMEELTSSSKDSRSASTAPSNRRARSRTPLRAGLSGRASSRTPGSHTGTPNVRKRQLEPDSASDAAKRQRITPVPEVVPGDENARIRSRLEELERELSTVQMQLINEKNAREAAEAARDASAKIRDEWQLALSSLQHRYEKRTKKCHQVEKVNKKTLQQVEQTKAQNEKLLMTNTNLRAQLGQVNAELTAARNDLKSTGGDVAALEIAHEEARTAIAKMLSMEKALETNKRDFDFTRSQYQNASNKASELANQVSDLETKNAVLAHQAGDEKRRLKEMSFAAATEQHLAKINQLEAEKRNRDFLLKKQDDEIRQLKRNRGVQTRGSSAQPGSPGPRSRQGSPAATAYGHLGPPSGSRASVLRNER